MGFLASLWKTTKNNKMATTGLSLQTLGFAITTIGSAGIVTAPIAATLGGGLTLIGGVLTTVALGHDIYKVIKMKSAQRSDPVQGKSYKKLKEHELEKEKDLDEIEMDSKDKTVETDGVTTKNTENTKKTSEQHKDKKEAKQLKKQQQKEKKEAKQLKKQQQKEKKEAKHSDIDQHSIGEQFTPREQQNNQDIKAQNHDNNHQHNTSQDMTTSSHGERDPPKKPLSEDEQINVLNAEIKDLISTLEHEKMPNSAQHREELQTSKASESSQQFKQNPIDGMKPLSLDSNSLAEIQKVASQMQDKVSHNEVSHVKDGESNIEIPVNVQGSDMSQGTHQAL